MYKIFYEERPIVLTTEPDRSQKYGLFYKFDNKDELYNIIDKFTEDKSIDSLNIYNADINKLWKHFKGYYKEVGAAGGLVQNNSGKYLIIIRNGMVDLPKGHIEKGESIEDCAVREVGEECGIKGHSIVKPLETTYHTYTLKGKSVLKITYWFLMEYNNQTEGKPQTEEGITEVQWLSTGEIKDVIKHSWPSLRVILTSIISAE